MSEQRDFLIERSTKPFIANVIAMVLTSYAMILGTLLVVVAIRRALGIDATLIWLSILLFVGISLTSVMALYSLIDGWARVSYFVANNKLIIQSNSRQHSSSSRSLKNLHKVSSSNAYRMMKSRDHGDVTLEFAKSGSTETVVLRGVKHPSQVAQKLNSYIES